MENRPNEQFSGLQKRLKTIHDSGSERVTQAREKAQETIDLAKLVSEISANNQEVRESLDLLKKHSIPLTFDVVLVLIEVFGLPASKVSRFSPWLARVLETSVRHVPKVIDVAERLGVGVPETKDDLEEQESKLGKIVGIGFDMIIPPQLHAARRANRVRVRLPVMAGAIGKAVTTVANEVKQTRRGN